MNSTLPNFLATPGATPGATPAASPQLNAAVLAGLLPMPTAAAVGEAPAAPPVDFSTLMAPAPAAPVITVQTTITPAAETPPVVTVAMAGHRFTAAEGTPPTDPALADGFVSVARPMMPRPSKWSRGDLAAVPGQAPVGSPWSRGALTPDSVPTGVGASRLQPTGVAPDESNAAQVPQELREQAVAFAATVIQSLLPGCAPQPEPAPAQSGALPAAGGQLAGAPTNGMVANPVHAARDARASSHPGVGTDLGRPPEGAASCAPAQKTEADCENAGFTPPAAVQPSSSETVARASAPDADNATSTGPSFVLADDGALEVKLAPLPLRPVTAVETADRRIDPGAMEFRVELDVPGQPTVRVESAGFPPESVMAGAVPVAPTATRENFAAKNRVQKTAREAAPDVSERNFEFAGDKEVTSTPASAGISVAKTDPIMPAAPIEESRAVRSPQDSVVLPGRAEFQVAQAPAERITAPVAVPAGQNFAERAVDTVTNLVEAQFSASMQKTGSVQLNLKFGGEDLSVRVELRDGAVHTSFRTDSAPLRAALEREWQAVAAASPEQMHRYAEPVFSPGANNHPASSSHGDARQQQQQAQTDGQQRAPRESFSDHPAFNRRSLVSESFVPEPPAPRVAAFLPTSLRLSALA